MAWKDMAYLLKGLEMIGNLTDTGMNIYDRVQGKRDKNLMADFKNQVRSETNSLEDFQRFDREGFGNRLEGLRTNKARNDALNWFDNYQAEQRLKYAQDDILDQFAATPSDKFSAERTITGIASKYDLPMDQAKALYGNAMTGYADNNALKQYAVDRAQNIANPNLSAEQIYLQNALAGQRNTGLSASALEAGQGNAIDILSNLAAPRQREDSGGATVMTDRNRLGTPSNITKVTHGDKEGSAYPWLANGGNAKQQQYLDDGAREVGNAFYAIAKQLGIDLDTIDAALTDTNGNYNPAKMLSQFPPELQQAYNQAITGMTNGVLANQPYTTAAQDAAATALARYQQLYGVNKGKGGRRSLSEIMGDEKGGKPKASDFFPR
jgi:hypothetical protein